LRSASSLAFFAAIGPNFWPSSLTRQLRPPQVQGREGDAHAVAALIAHMLASSTAA
jgi:hypothetical protein